MSATVISSTLACASCGTAWDVDYLMTLWHRDRLFARGFAHIALPNGGLAINYCPHCEPQPPAPAVLMEVPKWMPSAPLF